MKISSITDIGLKREENQDAIYTFSQDDANFICVLCDGMGGHKGGKQAAELACSSIKKEYKAFLKDPKKPIDWLTDTFFLINNKILEKSKEDPELDGMGTTMSVLLSLNGKLYYAHVGDTRIYKINKKALCQVSIDHTYVNDLIRRGIISPEQAKTHPQRHILINVLGVNDNLTVETGTIGANFGVFMCTDGLYDLIDDKEIFRLLEGKENSLSKLVNVAKECGGRDNISAIYVDGSKNN